MTMQAQAEQRKQRSEQRNDVLFDVVHGRVRHSVVHKDDTDPIIMQTLILLWVISITFVFQLLYDCFDSESDVDFSSIYDYET